MRCDRPAVAEANSRPERIPRRRALAANAAFGAAFLALQRVVFDEQPSLWEGDSSAPVSRPFAGNLVWRAQGGGQRVDRFVARLGRGLADLLEALAAPNWQVLPLHRKATWAGALDGRPAHPPLRRARESLLRPPPEGPGLPPRFAGALRFDAASAGQTVPLWFWAARCGVMPGGLFATAGALPLVASLCRHGNLHLEVYDAALLRRLEAMAQACGFGVVEGGCREEFGRGDGGAIAGRALRV